MTRTIRIDDDVYEGLKKLADPFDDTPNTVIRRLLNPTKENNKADSSYEPSMVNLERSKKGSLTPQHVFEDWLLSILYNKFGGKAKKKEVTKTIIFEMQKHNLLKSSDYEKVTTGETKAENTIAWGRNRLKEQGLIDAHSETGIWALTADGSLRASKLDLHLT